MTPLLKPSASTKTSTGSVALIPGTSSDPFRRLFDLWLQQMCLLLVDFKEMEPLQVWNGEGVDLQTRGDHLQVWRGEGVDLQPGGDHLLHV